MFGGMNYIYQGAATERGVVADRYFLRDILVILPYARYTSTYCPSPSLGTTTPTFTSLTAACLSLHVGLEGASHSSKDFGAPGEVHLVVDVLDSSELIELSSRRSLSLIRKTLSLKRRRSLSSTCGREILKMRVLMHICQTVASTHARRPMILLILTMILHGAIIVDLTYFTL